jgi:hypothetical protein
MHKCLFVLTTALITSDLLREGGCETPSDQQSATLKSMSARDEPGGIEPAIGLAVIRQPVDVPGVCGSLRNGGQFSWYASAHRYASCWQED